MSSQQSKKKEEVELNKSLTFLLCFLPALSHALLIVPLAWSVLYEPALVADEVFGYSYKASQVVAIAVGSSFFLQSPSFELTISSLRARGTRVAGTARADLILCAAILSSVFSSLRLVSLVPLFHAPKLSIPLGEGRARTPWADLRRSSLFFFPPQLHLGHY